MIVFLLWQREYAALVLLLLVVEGLKYSWWWMEIYSLGHHEGSGTAWTLSVLVLAGLN
jgi:hypothetical protein